MTPHQAFKDSLLYWDGNQFVNSTLNKKYLELVGDDSTYYKNYYFSKGEGESPSHKAMVTKD